MLGFVQKSLHPPDAVEACSAGRFTAGPTKDSSPAEHAAFLAMVIEAVVPIVDESIVR
jgi:hypothetical protein